MVQMTPPVGTRKYGKTKHTKTYYKEAFGKIHEALNMIHHVRRTDSNLCVPTVLWSYRTICKNLTTWALLKLKYEVNVVIPMEHPKPSPHIVAPIDIRFRKA